jgi:hypothetical protein
MIGVLGSLAFITQLLVGAPATPACSPLNFAGTECTSAHADIDGDHVDVGAGVTTPGSGVVAPGGPSPAVTPRPTPPASNSNGAITVGPDGQLQQDAAINRPPITATGPATIADLINFRPTPGVARMEPLGWTVVGLPTNFWAQSGAEVQTGILLGQLADVRFFPASYQWSYGDGEVEFGTASGSSWAGLRVEEFTPTPASHAYSAAGRYTIDLRVSFAVEYRYAGSEWVLMEGVVPAASASLTAIVGRASTVLVGDDCTENRSGIGC